MPDVLIRGLTPEAISRIDAEATELGLSRNEYLRRRFESTTAGAVRVTAEDLRRAAEATQDLLDPDVMNSAWR